MDTKKIETLIELAKKHGLHEIEVGEGAERIRIAIAGSQSPNAGIFMQHAVAQASQLASAAVPQATEAPQNRKVVRSPLVGTFYAAPSPNVAPFVEPGKKIRKGDKLCIVEAMKMMNEIEAEHDMIIKEILIQNGQAIQFDQALFSYE